jgi:hypothetical protein
MADFDPGDVWDALNDRQDGEEAAKKVNAAADALASVCDDAVQEMAQLALDEGDCGFAEEVAEHEAAFVEKLAKVALHVALEKWKASRKAAA